MKKLSKKLKLLLWISAAIIVLVVFCIWQNNSLVVSNFVYHNSKIPVDFNNYKIVQISDLHNKMFGEGQSKLLQYIENLSPDIIIVTGDLIDRHRYKRWGCYCIIRSYFASG